MSSEASHIQWVGARFQARLAALVGQPLFWFLFVVLGLAIPIARAVNVALPKPLPILSTVPPFAFTDQNGESFGTRQLEGKVWVANAIFTRCPTVCPLSTQRMFQVQHHARGLGDYFHIVSFSVDPENDTPGVLHHYAKEHKVSPRMWTFLTGDAESLKQTLNGGLKIYMGKQAEPSDDLMSIGHGSHFVLVDSKMRIRNYYDPTDSGAIDALLRDAGLLATRGD